MFCNLFFIHFFIFMVFALNLFQSHVLQAGLFVYDIFWVFFTPVMVSVAKSFDAPIKVKFFANEMEISVCLCVNFNCIFTMISDKKNVINLFLILSFKLFCSFYSPQQIQQGHFQCLALVILLSLVGWPSNSLPLHKFWNFHLRRLVPFSTFLLQCLNNSLSK